MTWRTSPIGRAHWLETDDVGPVSRCGKWRPEASPPYADASTERCHACLRLFAGRDLANPCAGPSPLEEQRPTPSHVKERNRAIRDGRRQGLTHVELADKYQVTLRTVRNALTRVPKSEARA